MQIYLNKSNKIIMETKQEHKANKTGFAFYHFPARSSKLNHFQPKHKKTR